MSLVAAGSQVFAYGGWRRARRSLLDARAAQRRVPGALVLLGPAASGKTMLLKRVAFVLRARGDTVHEAVGTPNFVPRGSQVLLIDDAAGLDDATLAALSTAPPCFCVLAGTPDFSARLPAAAATIAVVGIGPLEPSEIAEFVQLRLAAFRSGTPSLSPDAFDSLQARTDWYPGPLALAIDAMTQQAPLAAAAPPIAAEISPKVAPLPPAPADPIVEPKPIAPPFMAAEIVPAIVHAPLVTADPIVEPEPARPAFATIPQPRHAASKSAPPRNRQNPWPGSLPLPPPPAPYRQKLAPSHAAGGATSMAMAYARPRGFTLPSWWQWPAVGTCVIFLAALALAVGRATTDALPPYRAIPSTEMRAAPPLQSSMAALRPVPRALVRPAPVVADVLPRPAPQIVVAAVPAPPLPTTSAATPLVHLVFLRGDGAGRRDATAAVRKLAVAHIAVAPPQAVAAGRAGPGIRYFYEEDRASAVAIQQALGPSFGASSLATGDRAPGTIEVLVAGPHD